MENLETVLNVVRKEYGYESITTLDQGYVLNIPVISTGILPLDILMGIGGFPRGRIIEVYGPESSGKTTACLHLIAEAQKIGELCAFIDMEHALDPKWGETIGVDIGALLVSQPDCAEDALGIMETEIKTNQVSIVVLDSVASLVTRAELDGDKRF